MALKWTIPVAGLVALVSAALPAQSAPLGVGARNTVEPSAVQSAHYRYYRHHRYYRYYSSPGVHFYYGHRYYGHRHHRHWHRWN